MPKEYQNAVLNIGLYIDPITGDSYTVHGDKTGVKFDEYPIKINGASALRYAELGHKALQDAGITCKLGLLNGDTWVFVLYADGTTEQKGVLTVGEYAADIIKNGAEAANRALAEAGWAQYKERQ